MKEAYTRLNWKIKYGKDYPSRLTPHKPKAMNTATAPKVTLPPVVKAPEKKKEALVLQDALSEAPRMRPVSPQSKETLYNGLSKEGKGRSQYLKRRMQKMPEERFVYPLLSSWEYGWRLGNEISCFVAVIMIEVTILVRIKYFNSLAEFLLDCVYR